MMSEEEEEAQARVLAASAVLAAHLPQVNLMRGMFGSACEIAVKQRIAEILDHEPRHLRPDQLLELYCLELIEAVKSHRLVAGFG